MKKILKGCIPLAMGVSFAYANVTPSIYDSSCKKYMHLSKSEISNNIRDNINSPLSNKSLAPLCLSLKDELVKADNSRGGEKIEYLQKAEKEIKTFKKFDLDVNTVKSAIKDEYKKLNSNMLSQRFIESKDKETIFLALTVVDNEVTINRVIRKDNKVLTVEEKLIKEQFISKYPSLAKAKGIRIKSLKTNANNVKQVSRFKLSRDNVNLRSDATSHYTAILDYKLPKGAVIYPSTRSIDNTWIESSGYYEFYYLEASKQMKVFWVMKKDFVPISNVTATSK